jgi:hypothetical protein
MIWAAHLRHESYHGLQYERAIMTAFQSPADKVSGRRGNRTFHKTNAARALKGRSSGYCRRLRNIHAAADNVTAPMTANGHSSGTSGPSPTPSR